jgi:glucose/arabinose dehydrogenase
MPSWSGALNEGQIQSLAILIAEQRVNRQFYDFKVDQELIVPGDPIATELVSFRIETVVTGIHSKPFSIASLPDGRILVTEKTQGLSIVSPGGER